MRLRCHWRKQHLFKTYFKTSSYTAKTTESEQLCTISILLLLHSLPEKNSILWWPLLALQSAVPKKIWDPVEKKDVILFLFFLFFPPPRLPHQVVTSFLEAQVSFGKIFRVWTAQIQQNGLEITKCSRQKNKNFLLKIYFNASILPLMAHPPQYLCWIW